MGKRERQNALREAVLLVHGAICGRCQNATKRCLRLDPNVPVEPGNLLPMCAACIGARRYWNPDSERECRDRAAEIARILEALDFFDEAPKPRVPVQQRKHPPHRPSKSESDRHSVRVTYRITPEQRSEILRRDSRAKRLNDFARADLLRRRRRAPQAASGIVDRHRLLSSASRIESIERLLRRWVAGQKTSKQKITKVADALHEVHTVLTNLAEEES